jgi:hypothetical protein
MKIAFWYIITVATGIALLFCLVGMVCYLQWEELPRYFDAELTAMSDYWFKNYGFYGAELPLLDGFGLFFGWACALLIPFLFSVWRLSKIAAKVSKEDWYKIGIITSIVVAPIVLVVALPWKYPN